MFGESKYSTSLFVNGKKLNSSDKLSDNNIGYTNEDQVNHSQHYILCLKGGEDAPKIFNRFR